MDDYATEPPLQQLRVLSLNCWGLKYVADKRRERLLAIADWIGNSYPSAASRASYHSDRSSDDSPAGGATRAGAGGYDVIALQEIWVRADFDIVAARANEAGLPYSRFFYSGAIGSGLAILSAHPIHSSFIHPYSLNGHPLHFIEGDFFAGKSVCGVTVQVEGIGLVDVLNSHMYAPGGEGEGVEGAHRVAQAWELAKIVREKAERGRHVLLTGDFNSQPYSIIMRILLSHGSLHDAFAATHPPPPSITSSTHRSLSPEQVMHQHGITCDSPLNTYSIPKLAKRGPRDETVIRGGKRLDYVLYRSPLSSGFVMRCEGTDIVLTELVPGLGVSYSDHFGLEATLSFIPTSATSLLSALPPPPPELPTSDLLTLLSTLRTCYSHTSSLSTLQLKFFALSLLLIPLLAFAASYQPLKYVNWIWVLLGIIDGVGGATMLYVGFVGGYWEMGSLRNVMSELENEVGWRRRVEGGGESRSSDEGWR